VWTAVIVAQVAVTVAFPAIVLLEVRECSGIRSYDVGFAADEYLAVQLVMDAAPGADVDGDAAAAAAHRARFGTLVETLRQRVAAEPGVVGVTFADRLPRTNYLDHRVALDDSASPSRAAARRSGAALTKIAYVDPSYFDVLEAPILAGRGFQAADLAPGRRVAIVDQGFVDQVLLGRNPIGRRVRIALGSTTPGHGPAGRLAAPGSRSWAREGARHDRRVGDRTRDRALPAGHAGERLPAADDDPHAGRPAWRSCRASARSPARWTRRCGSRSCSAWTRSRTTLLWVLGLWLRMTLVITGVALLLSLAGIYAVLSFTVARRTREIGVRVALGANQRRVLTAVFRRPLTQVGVGVVAGGLLIAVGALLLSAHVPDGQTQLSEARMPLAQVAILVAYAAFMLGVCLLACIVPTRRALRVEPTVAMRVD
jgi:hypothetical protein